MCTPNIKFISVRDCKIVGEGFISGMAQLNAIHLEKLYVNYRYFKVLFIF